jgi:hypothetical protein
VLCTLTDETLPYQNEAYRNEFAMVLKNSSCAPDCRRLRVAGYR